MVIHCTAADCQRPVPVDLQWRLVVACNLDHVLRLFGDELDEFDCPLCGGERTVQPSLAGVFIVENRLVLLDRGMDPEPPAREAIAPLIEAVRYPPLSDRVMSLEVFKARFAHLMKATGRRYPYSVLDPVSFEENLANWQCLQGEILTAILAGAMGIVPGFGVHAGHKDGKVETHDYTVDLIKNLSLDVVRCWLIGIASLSQATPLEELLVRLVDTCGGVATIADEIVDLLTTIRKQGKEHQLDDWFWFHFHAVEASLLTMLGRPNPHSADWALHYLMVRCAARAEVGNADRFLLSRRRISATISYRDAWNAIAGVLHSYHKNGELAERTEKVREVKNAAEDLGYDGLFGAVWDGGFRIGVSGSGENRGEHTPETLAQLIVSASKPNDGLPWSAKLNIWTVSWFKDATAVARLFDLLKPTAEADRSGYAGLLAWFGERMKLLGTPDLGLDRIGRIPADWEDGLELADKRRLWTERSNLLRLAGEFAAALQIAQAVLAITFGHPDASPQQIATALQNCGILLRETGRFPEAVQLLQQAALVAPTAQRWGPLQSLAATYLHMGRIADAADLLPRARASAGGADNDGVRTGLLLTEISARLQLKQFARADALLRELPLPAELPDAAVVGFSTLLRIRRAGYSEGEVSDELGIDTVSRLAALGNAFAGAGNYIQAQVHVHAAALLSHDLDLPLAASLWWSDAEFSLRAKRLPDPRTAIELAMLRLDDCTEPDPDILCDQLDIILASLGAKAGPIALESATMDLLSPLDDAFKRLASLVYTSGYGVNETQLVAEIRRNAHRRALRLADGDEIPLGSRVATSEVMTEGHSTFLVLEWCDLADGDLLGLVSLMKPGNARAGYLYYTEDIDLFGTAEAVANRIPMWRKSRAGEPFAVSGWDAVRNWLRLVADNYLPGGGHVVVIDHIGLTGLPFHIALAPEWTVSYASSWMAIEAAVVANGTAPTSPRLGVLHAPRANETDAVRGALALSAEGARSLAREAGLSCDYAGPGTGDASRLRALLQESDVLKVLCHGQIWKDDREVALVIDHDGRSPPGYSLSEALASGGGHRFGREALQDLANTARTVFLGACSAGILSIGGLDERTSFCSLLADAGTSAVVASRWKIDAELTLPILDHIMARFVGGASLAGALTDAAEAAVARGVPRWQAYAFVIEGAWI